VERREHSREGVISQLEDIAYVFQRWGTRLQAPLKSRVTPGDGLDASQIRRYDADTYKLHVTQTRHTPKGETKPNPKLLSHIVEECGAEKATTAYIGDKLDKDVRMAQAVGVIDVYAKYGDSVRDERYELLRRVTHWRSPAVETERRATQENVSPTLTLEHSFGQLLQTFEFTAFERARRTG
jgi:hypothetical protein